jgi:hypothetical protein
MFENQHVRSLVAGLMVGQFVVMAVLPAGAALMPTDPVWTGSDNRLGSGTLLLAQYNESYGSPSEANIDGERDPALSETHAYSGGVTRGVVQIIQRGSVECQNVVSAGGYHIDCLASVLARAASTIERRQNYRQAGRELRSLSRKLKSIRSKYADPNAPAITKNRRTYRAVSKANLAQANREATTAIDETVTKLLRSAGNSEKRKVHYAQIATAVGSTKRLLRS